MIRDNGWGTLCDVMNEGLASARDDVHARRGYAAITRLLPMIDTLGTYIVGKGPEQNFKVLNESIFGLDLSVDETSALAKQYRGPLLHAGLAWPRHYVRWGEPTDQPFAFGGGVAVANVVPLFALVDRAWTKFQEAHREDVLLSEKLAQFATAARAPSTVRLLELDDFPATTIKAEMNLAGASGWCENVTEIKLEPEPSPATNTVLIAGGGVSRVVDAQSVDAVIATVLGRR